ncbi:MAG: alpha/beta fold hydrolase [Succinivibrio sp.]
MNRYTKAFLNVESYVAKHDEIERLYRSSVEIINFTTPDGLTLVAARLNVENAKDKLVIIPGRGEIPHKFAEFFYTLSELKISAVVIFARGQYLSSRILKDKNKCHIDKFENFSKDISFVLDELKIRDYKLLAFSLGGLISLDIIVNGKNKPSRAALISPYLWPHFKLRKSVLKAVITFFGTMPGLRTMYTPHGSTYKRVPFEENNHAHCKERYNYYHDYFALHPNYTIGGPTFHFVKECLKKQLQLKAAKFEFPIPVYCQSSGDDQVVSTPDAQEFFELHKNDPIKPRFEIVDGAWHDVINETDNYRTPMMANALKFLFG